MAPSQQRWLLPPHWRKCRHYRPRRSRQRIAADAHAISVSGPGLRPLASRTAHREQDCEPSNLDELLASSRIVFVFASSTSENQGFLGAREFALMSRGSILLLMSRAGVADFAALEASVRSGHIRAGIDVFPVEPLPRDSSLRSLEGVTGAAACPKASSKSVDSFSPIRRGLPPQVCKRAERETAARMRSRPVAAS
jgi:lactate dehydrogenase-like 2-hydroxyacid dehydrogenase